MDAEPCVYAVLEGQMELRLPTGELWHVIHPGRMVEGLMELVAMIFASSPQNSSSSLMLPRCVDIVASSEKKESVVVGCFSRSKLAFLRHELMTHPDVMIRFVQMAFLRLNSVTFMTSVRYLGLVTELRPSTSQIEVVVEDVAKELEGVVVVKESIKQKEESIKGGSIREMEESKEESITEIQESESIKEIEESIKKESMKEDNDAYWLERAQMYAAKILGLDRDLIPHMTMEQLEEEERDEIDHHHQGMVRCFDT